MLESLNLIACTSMAAAGLCLITSLVVAKRQRAERAQQSGRILAMQRKIDATLQDEGFEAEREAFSVTLKTASLTTELQRPRLQTLAKVDKPAPEKYKILMKLAAQGMGADEIASILGISRMEAGQLLSLSHMARVDQ